MKTPRKAKNPPWKGASPIVKFLKPTASPPIMPKIIKTPITRNIMTTATLIVANQYSDSPYPLTDNKLRPRIRARNKTLHNKEELSGNQYLIMSVAADNSAAMVIAQLYQKFQPIAKPREGSTKREAYVSNDPESGIYVASSPKLVIRK
ncbi:hypothetical protein D3C77_511620 [compost metagenome]